MYLLTLRVKVHGRNTARTLPDLAGELGTKLGKSSASYGSSSLRV